jgi:hypothetical protein
LEGIGRNPTLQEIKHDSEWVAELVHSEVSAFFAKSQTNSTDGYDFALEMNPAETRGGRFDLARLDGRVSTNRGPGVGWFGTAVGS